MTNDKISGSLSRRGFLTQSAAIAVLAAIPALPVGGGKVVLLSEFESDGGWHHYRVDTTGNTKEEARAAADRVMRESIYAPNVKTVAIRRWPEGNEDIHFDTREKFVWGFARWSTNEADILQ